jgi:hypothetical protein
MNIKPFCIFKDIMNSFITACGLALLEIFFGGGNEVITKNLVVNLVTANFACLLIVVFFLQLVFWGFNKSDSKSTPSLHSFQKNDNKKALEIIRVHEAGHAVMAYLQNIKIVKCIATAEEGKIITQVNQGLMNGSNYEKLILIDYAGAASEKIIYGEFRAGSIGYGSDFEQAEQKIKNLLLLDNEIRGYTTGGECFAALVREKSVELFDKACEIICENRETVLKISEELAKTPTISGEKLEQIILGEDGND